MDDATKTWITKQTALNEAINKVAEAAAREAGVELTPENVQGFRTTMINALVNEQNRVMRAKHAEPEEHEATKYESMTPAEVKKLLDKIYDHYLQKGINREVVGEMLVDLEEKIEQLGPIENAGDEPEE